MPAVIIHCGGNDIGLVPCGELLFHIKFTIAILSSMLPGTSLVWSSILPRMKWRYSENIRNIENTLDLSKLQLKLQKNMTINIVNNLIIHISNWLHEME
jgi:hypothetical protein